MENDLISREKAQEAQNEYTGGRRFRPFRAEDCYWDDFLGPILVQNAECEVRSARLHPMLSEDRAFSSEEEADAFFAEVSCFSRYSMRSKKY
jgi:hypothetical protein